MRDYKKILAWQKADDLTVEIYEVTRLFPTEEIYSLTGLIRSVEKEVGLLSRTTAKITSALVLAFGLRALVSSL